MPEPASNATGHNGGLPLDLPGALGMGYRAYVPGTMERGRHP